MQVYYSVKYERMGRGGHDRMVVGFTAAFAISSYRH